MARAARQRAQDFADHLNLVLNRTVTTGRLILVAHDDAPTEFDVTSGSSPLKLNRRKLWLSIRQRVRVEGGKVHTLLYRYQLVSDAKDPRSSWLIRWDYTRHWPTENPWYPSHVHAHGDLKHGGSKQLKDMHIPAERIPLEMVLWHLLAEWAVTPLSDDWRELLRESIEGFRERRTV